MDLPAILARAPELSLIDERRLATLLGAHLIVEPGHDIAETVRRVATDRGTTYILMGTPRPRHPLKRLTSPALPFRLLERAAGRRPAHRRRPQPPRKRGRRMTALHILLTVTLAIVAAVPGTLYARDRRQRAATLGVPTDARVDRGRTMRHAMREAMTHERFDRIVVAAGHDGLKPDDVACLLGHAPCEVVIIRPGGDDPLTPIHRHERTRAVARLARHSATAQPARSISATPG
jgi:hypothetical protein